MGSQVKIKNKITEIEGCHKQCIDFIKIADNYAIDFIEFTTGITHK